MHIAIETYPEPRLQAKDRHYITGFLVYHALSPIMDNLIDLD